ncbi:MAG: peptide deformylase [Deltaproteobacteria bacterium]|nr:peptide deformylase [Deltaproteobacteria bacterium]
MAVRAIVEYPQQILRERCEPVEAFGERIGRLLDDLAESMYANKGVGLAAPQIGQTHRAVVIDVEQREGQPKLVELVNPEILERSSEMREGDEGCLSFPGEWEKVVRPARVRARAFDRRGEPFEIEAEGMLARAIQHELDHLDGVLFIDHLSRLKRSLIDRRMRKRASKAS